MNLLNLIANNWDSIAAAGTVIGGLLWNRGKKLKEADLWDSLLKFGRQAFTRLMHDARLYDDAHVRKVITEALWDGLERIGVKKTPALEKIVIEAAEYVKGELAELVLKHHFGQLVKPLERTAEKLGSLTDSITHAVLEVK